MRTGFVIPAAELSFRASRAGGPGGQHVNKVSTRAEVLWDVARTSRLTEPERQRVMRKLANRIGADGILRVVADDTRSLTRNRDAAVRRLVALVDAARRAPRPRKKTRPTLASRAARLDTKRRRGTIKRDRSRDDWED